MPLRSIAHQKRPLVIANRTTVAFAVVVLVWFGSWTPVIAGSSPELHTVLPRGVQRGTEQTLTFKGVRLDGAQSIHFYKDGISVKSLAVVNGKQLKVVVEVAADCELGQHAVQVHCRQGVSDFRTLFVGPFAAVPEQEPNNGFKTAQRLTLNRTATGVIAGQDADYFVVAMKSEQRLSVEVEAMRLGNFFDSVVAVYDSDRNEIGFCDDTEVHNQDGFISCIAPTDGDYYVMIADATSNAAPSSDYRLHVGEFDRPNVIFPPGGTPGKPFVGEMLMPSNSRSQSPLGADWERASLELRLPAPDPADGNGGDEPLISSSQLSASPGLCLNDGSPSRIPFRNNDLKNVTLDRTDDKDKTALGFKEALTIAVPVAINGRMHKPKQRHYFKFTAKKHQKLSIDTFAKTIGSPFDPVINVFDEKRKSLIGNDDAGGKPDAALVFVPPADGVYYLRVLDYLNRGGDAMVYRIEIRPVTPTLTLNVKRNDRFSQTRMAMAVPQGGRFAAVFSAKKNHFQSDVGLEFLGLPEGVTAMALPLKAKVSQLPVVFQCVDDAKLEFRPVAVAAQRLSGDLSSRSALASPESSVGFAPAQADRLDLVTQFSSTSLDALGPPNNTVYHRTVVDRLAVAVIDPLPFKIKVQPLAAPLVRNGSAYVKVIASRDKGFKEKIRVRFPYKPPGIGTKYQLELKPGQTEIDYPINANKNAQLGTWPFYVIATANVNGPAWTSSQLETVDVEEPFCAIQSSRCVGARNQTLLVECQIDQRRPFNGDATATLKALPPHVRVAGPLTFDQTTEAIKFQIFTDDKTPLGQHKNLFVEVAIPVGEGRSVARAGDVVLQINQPVEKNASGEEQSK